MSSIHVLAIDRRGKEVALQSTVGRPLMEALRDRGLVEAICGGQAACATCHVHIDKDWYSRVGEAGEQESDMLDTSLEKTEHSRLSCQIITSADMDGLIITIAQDEG